MAAGHSSSTPIRDRNIYWLTPADAHIHAWQTRQVDQIKDDIRNLYWHIRTARRGLQQARLRRYYRKIQPLKTALMERHGYTKQDVLALIRTCRSSRTY